MDIKVYIIFVPSRIIYFYCGIAGKGVGLTCIRTHEQNYLFDRCQVADQLLK